jgi:CPA2 family monovalent cation:H+ antiporter-2
MAETLLLEVGVMFAALAAVGFVAAKIGMSPIPFYVIAGIALSPAVSKSDFVTVGAELGIVFLLFFLGLEFNLDRLLADRAHIGKAGLLDLVVNFPVGFLLGFVLFGGVVPAIVIAGIVYISSSAVITKTMLDSGWIANPESGPILGTLVFEDLVIAVYLSILGALVLGGGSPAAVARTIAIAAGFLLALLALVRFGTSTLERLLDTTSSEYFLLRAIATTVLIAGAALALDVSEAVAAFFVGMAFSSTSIVHEIEEALLPIRDTFAAVFFFWIGLFADPEAFGAVIDLIALAVLITTPAKLVSGFYSGRIYDLTDRRSLRVGLAMVTRGEFSLIIASAPLAATEIADPNAALPAELALEIYAFTVGYVLVMSALGTTLMQLSPLFERYLPTTSAK